RSQPPESVTLTQVLEEAIGKQKDRQTKTDQREVADVLKSLGWVRDPSRHRANGRCPVWRNGSKPWSVLSSQDSADLLDLAAIPANCNGTPHLHEDVSTRSSLVSDEI